MDRKYIWVIAAAIVAILMILGFFLFAGNNVDGAIETCTAAVPCTTSFPQSMPVSEKSLPLQKVTWGRVFSVYDGDTIQIIGTSCDESFGGYPVRLKVRLLGIDTPELPSAKKDKLENEVGIIARDALRREILDKIVRVHSTGKDVYGRVLSYIYVYDTMQSLGITAPLTLNAKKGFLLDKNGVTMQSINNWLVEEGYACEYKGRKHDWTVRELKIMKELGTSTERDVKKLQQICA